MNGIVSLLGAILAGINLAWVLTIPGLVAYALWNILVAAIMTLVIAEFRSTQVSR